MVLQVDRTIVKYSTRQTPYTFLFGTQAVIPPEVIILIASTRFYNQEEKYKILANDLDTVDELRDLSKIRIMAYQQKISKSYNKNILIRRFWVGDLFL